MAARARNSSTAPRSRASRSTDYVPETSGTNHLVKTLSARALLRVSGSPDERIAAIAALQRGRVSRRQLLAAGVTREAIQGRVERGVLHRLYPGVYAVGHSGPVALGRETAALLACREGTVLSHRTAAALWGIGPPLPTDEPVHVLTAGQATSRRAGIVSHRTRILLPRDVRLRHHLPVTSPARTLLDSAEILPSGEFEWALDDALARPIVGPAQIRDISDRFPSRPGAKQLTHLMEARRGRGVTRSRVERDFLALVRKAHLPSPDRNVQMLGYNVDFYWRAERVAVEIDTYGTHGSKSAFERDRRKDQALRDAGIDLARFTDTQIDGEPFVVIASLTRMLTTHYTS